MNAKQRKRLFDRNTLSLVKYKKLNKNQKRRVRWKYSKFIANQVYEKFRKYERNVPFI